ncbi:MAG TPA: hypothetical protein PK614_06560, partial [Nitrospira sp.]|nr:hypothetical protein [Nitrospira sp.]
GGLWHGAAMHFVLWGGFHGLLLMLTPQRSQAGPPRTLLGTVLRRLGWFQLIAFGWLLFRVQDMKNFMDFIEGCARFTGGTRLSGVFYLILCAGILSHLSPLTQLERFGEWWIARPVPIQAAAYAVLLIFYAGVTLEAPAFIYFQF